MSWINLDDVLAQLQAAGLQLEGGDPQVDTPGPVRRKVEGDRERRGWYRLYTLALSGGDRLIVGSYGIWRGDDNGATKIELPNVERKKLDPEQQAAIRARQAEDKKRAEADRRREVERAAGKATRWWAQAIDQGESPYLKRKGITGLHGARLSPAGNLVIPMQDGKGATWGLQVIYQDPKVKERKGRDKDFAPPGLAKKGHWFQIGSPMASGGILLVCEGFATGASLHEATGLPVAVAFDAGNLMPVAEALKKQYRARVKMLFCADDDYLQKCMKCGTYTTVEAAACTSCGLPHGKENTGVTRAQVAALAVDGGWVKPVFGDRPLERKGPTDFNDLHVAPGGGLDAVRTQVEASITALRWRSAQPGAPAQALPREGGGDGREAMPSMIPIWEAVERFAMVYGGKGTLFDFREHLLVPKTDVLDILPEHGWRDMRQTKIVVRLDEVGFDPAGTDARIRCNLWGGWPTTPKAGNCQRLLDLLEYLCSEEKKGREIFNWILKWLAYPIQHPGAKMKTALMVHGPQGAGKNLFFETVMSIYGEYGRIIDQGAIEDKFNDWASRKLFLIADEVVARQDLYHIKNKLKGLITGEWIRINPKNVSAHDERNHVNLVFLSNDYQPTAIEKDDRRHAVIWTPAALPPTFYLAVRDELLAGGAAAFHDYLMKLDLGDFDEHAKPPMTRAKQELIDVNLGSVERFHRDWQAGDTPHPFCPCASSDLYTAYRRWCGSDGVSRPREQNQFAAYFAKLPGWEKGHYDRYETKDYYGARKRQRMVIPSPKDLAETAKAGGTNYVPPPEKAKSEWLTDCYLDFHNSIVIEAEGWGPRKMREAA